MSYIALYRKYRPQVFDDIVEQQHVINILKNSVRKDRIAHAYLFCGTRGTGKTTMAQLFARAINCLEPNDGNPCNKCEICTGIQSGRILDVMEIDAASNNSVDNIREIREEVIYSPSQAKFKVYIIDEVHMLSTGAFNALLKTLEEPPPHVVFILATTEPNRLPATILSRCQRYDFRRISAAGIIKRMEKITQDIGLEIDKKALKLISTMADGAMRDALSIMDQCTTSGKDSITYDDVISISGISDYEFIAQIVEAIAQREIVKILELVEKLVMDGKDMKHFLSELIHYYRNLLIVKLVAEPEKIVDLSEGAFKDMKKLCTLVNVDGITFNIRQLSALEGELKWTTQPRILLEVALIALCENIASSGQNTLEERIFALEKKIASQPVTASEASSKQTAAANDNSTKKAAANNNHKSKAIDKKAIDKIEVSDKTLDKWDNVLTALKEDGKMVLFSNLAGTQCRVMNENNMAIVFEGKGGIAKMIASKADNQKLLAEYISRIMEREIKLHFYGSDQISSKASPPQGRAEDDFTLKNAVKMAKQLDVPIDIFDE